jgi:hypothetical protein
MFFWQVITGLSYVCARVDFGITTLKYQTNLKMVVSNKDLLVLSVTLGVEGKNLLPLFMYKTGKRKCLILMLLIRVGANWDTCTGSENIIKYKNDLLGVSRDFAA